KTKRKSLSRSVLPKHISKLHHKKALLHKRMVAARKSGNVVSCEDLRTKIKVLAKSIRSQTLAHTRQKEEHVLRAGDIKTFWRYVNSKLTSRPGVPVLKTATGETAITDL